MHTTSHRFARPLSAIQILDELLAPQRAGTRGIPMDFYESDTAYLVKALVPGFTKEQVSIDIEGSTLTVSAKKEAAAVEGFTLLRSEGIPSELRRVVGLPEKIDPEQASASFADGVLELRLPKQAPAKRSVKID